MRTLLLISLLPFLAFAGDTPKSGIGFRLGDPSGITFKKYTNGRAMELNFGRSYIWNNGWYNNSFSRYYKNKNYNYYVYDYIAYRNSFPLSLQFHYLFQKPVPVKGESKTGRLDWYYGMGAQVRWQRFTYEYRYLTNSSSNWVYAEDHYLDLDLGVDGVIGVEFIFSEIPLALALDGNIFMEVFDLPFHFWWQSGLAIRYNF